MKFLIKIMLYSSLYSRLDSVIVNNRKLTALNDSYHALKLYQELQNEDKPTETDPANLNPETRESICEELVTHPFFNAWDFSPVQMIEIRSHLRQPDDLKIFYRIYECSSENSRNFYTYNNEFRLQEMTLSLHVGSHNCHDHFFVCPQMNPNASDEENIIIPFYVSKEYDLSPFSELYMPGRFIIGIPKTAHNDVYNLVALAEEPAEAHVAQNFNVELYYLRIRKIIDKATSDDIDPMCKLISDDLQDLNNQHYRLCVAVLMSSYFEGQFDYPDEMPDSCYIKEVSFKTKEAQEAAAGKRYYERITPCDSKHMCTIDDGEWSDIYLSRAYMSNTIFVYRSDPKAEKLYLENMSTNIKIVDELDSFHFVEY